MSPHSDGSWAVVLGRGSSWPVSDRGGPKTSWEGESPSLGTPLDHLHWCKAHPGADPELLGQSNPWSGSWGITSATSSQDRGLCPHRTGEKWPHGSLWEMGPRGSCASNQNLFPNLQEPNACETLPSCTEAGNGLKWSQCCDSHRAGHGVEPGAPRAGAGSGCPRREQGRELGMAALPNPRAWK